MRRVSIRQFRSNLVSELTELPLVVTRNGRDIIMCTQIVDVSDMECVHKNEFKPECVHKSEKGVHNERESINAPGKSVERRLSVQKEAQAWRNEIKPMPKKGKK